MRISDWSSDVCSSDLLAAPDKGVRVHNYPEEWAYWFDQNRLGPSDPVHRASQRSRAGFLWHDMRRYDAPRPGDETILAEAERHGIGDGLPVPAHIPGDDHGSVSSEERRVGKDGVSTCRSRWSLWYLKKKQNNNNIGEEH